jgi:hypothetical protein
MAALGSIGKMVSPTIQGRLNFTSGAVSPTMRVRLAIEMRSTSPYTPIPRYSIVTVRGEPAVTYVKLFRFPLTTANKTVGLKSTSYSKPSTKPSGTGAITGITKRNGVLARDCRVGLYSRASMQLLESTISDRNGVFTFTKLDKNTSEFFVVGLDPGLDVTYNAIIFDKLTPV